MSLQRFEKRVEAQADHGDREDTEIHLRNQKTVLAIDDR
jgi:hypothetical protein